MSKPTKQVSTIAVSQSYSGPIPQASELEKYEQVCKGAADRLITLAENEARHRHSMQSKDQKDRTVVIILSTICSCCIILALCCLVAYAIHEKQTQIATSIAAIGTVGGLFFWFGKKYLSK